MGCKRKKSRSQNVAMKWKGFDEFQEWKWL